MKLQNFIASILAGVLWVVIIGALPFIEEMIYPAKSTNDSWQRGLVLLPVFLIFTIPFLYFTSSSIVSKGWKKLLPFVLATCLTATFIGSILVIPSAIVIAGIGMFNITEIFQGVVYSLIIIFSTVIAPAILWWLLGNR